MDTPLDLMRRPLDFNLIELFSSFLLNFIMSCLIEFLSVEVGSNDLVFRGERRIFVNCIKIKIIQ